MSRQIAFTALATGALILGLANAGAAESCTPVQGKIFNNFADPYGSATLGVVALVYGNKQNAIKLKCALVGTSEAPDGTPADSPYIEFRHTISCDDAELKSANDGSGAEIPVHSSIVLKTTGLKDFPSNPKTQLFTFKEESVPYPGYSDFARGLFFGVTGGKLQVDGVVYKSQVPGVPGSIDMTFTGEVCNGG